MAESAKPDRSAMEFWTRKSTGMATWKALFLAFKWDFIKSGSSYFVAVALRFVGPLLLGFLVRFVSQTQANVPNPELTQSQAYGVAVAMAASQVLSSMFTVHADFIMVRVGVKSRDALIASTFRHTAALTNASRSQTNDGLIFSLVSNDAQVALDFTRFWNQAWTAIFILIGGIVYIVALVGNESAWAGMSILVLFVPLSLYLGKAQTRLQRQKMQVTDARVKMTSEALQGIRVVKFNAFETVLEKQLDEVREEELNKLRHFEYVRAVTTPLSVAIPNVASVLTFITYVSLGNALNPANTFSTIALYVIVRSPFVTFPLAISMFARAVVANNRFDRFFALERSNGRLDEVFKSPILDSPATTNEGAGPVLVIDDATFVWGGKSQANDKPQAKNQVVITPEHTETLAWQLQLVGHMEIPRGSLVAIIGEVGAGKSAFVNAILGEMTLTTGSLRVDRTAKIGYCPQEPFILNASLRDNVLFGEEFEVQRYVEALRVSALARDLDQLPASDQTEIGERGVTLSGGQKARVGLARAVYSNAQFILMDDPLSAVDAHVGKFIFEHCICGKQLRGKTRMLVTNNLHVLSKVDMVMVMDHGTLVEWGTRDELLRKDDGALKRITQNMIFFDDVPEKDAEPEITVIPPSQRILLPQYSQPRLDQQKDQPETVVKKLDTIGENGEDGVKDSANHDDSKENTLLVNLADKETADYTANMLEPQKQSDFQKQRSRLIVTETRVRGKISNDVYKAYWLSGARGHVSLVVLLLLVFVFSEGIFLSVDAYLASATQQPGPLDVANFLTVYGSLTAAFIFGVVLRSFAFAIFHVEAVRRIYRRLAHHILRYPMSYFWSQPLGRILNRLSADCNVVDTQLGQSWLWLLLTVVRVVGILALIIYAIPLFATAVIPLFFIYLGFREIYRRSARDLQRIASVARSPVMNSLSETLSGTATIRAFGKVEHWIQKADEHIAFSHRSMFLVESLAVWLTMYLEFLGAVVILVTALAIVASAKTVGPGFVGLALAYVLNIVINLNMSVKQAVMVEQQMSSVERLEEFTTTKVEDDLDSVSTAALSFSGKYSAVAPEQSEPKRRSVLKTSMFWRRFFNKADVLSKHASSSAPILTVSQADLREWPSRGAIRFDDVWLKYRPDLEWALTRFSLSIRASERVGVAGTTGAGKTTIFSCLTRLTDPSKGQIFVDGVNICHVAKRVLRRKITIVPQDPVVFRGTLRYNVDPFEEFPDEEIWRALRECRIDRIASLGEHKLDTKLGEDGLTLSLGERALVCLARAVLRRSKIVLLDEASSSLDSNTDQLIQETIRSRFADATLIVIAHRLDTIVDLDTILVMGKGALVEKGIAHDLLTNAPATGAFAKLVQETGEENSKLLKERARAAYENVKARFAKMDESSKMRGGSLNEAAV